VKIRYLFIDGGMRMRIGKKAVRVPVLVTRGFDAMAAGWCSTCRLAGVRARNATGGCGALAGRSAISVSRLAVVDGNPGLARRLECNGRRALTLTNQIVSEMLAKAPPICGGIAEDYQRRNLLPRVAGVSTSRMVVLRKWTRRCETRSAS